MIALSMLYLAAAGLVTGAAAWLVERAALAVGRPARWAWAAALAATVALGGGLVGREVEAPAPAQGATAGVVRLPGGVLPGAPAAATPRGWAAVRSRMTALVAAVPATVNAPAAWAALDRPLAAAWGVLTALVLARAALARRRVRRMVRLWPARAVGRARVLISPDVGPAVLGAARPAVVLPGWALGDPRLPLMLAHESEHVRARDPLLLAAGRLAAALVPWNPAAWWQLRRLRAAVEVDCDRRVLAPRAAQTRTYAHLLLDVAGRTPAAVPDLALAPAPTLLRRRILLMTARRPAPARLLVPRVALPLLGGVALTALACELPRPTGPRAVTSVAVNDLRPSAVDAGAPTPTDTVRAVLARFLPDLARAPEGRLQTLWVLQRANGDIDRVTRGGPGTQQTVNLRSATLRLNGDSGGLRVEGRAGAPVVGAAGSADDPADLAKLDPGQIASVEVLKAPPGRLIADSVSVVWVRLRAPGAAADPGGAMKLSASAATAAARITVNVGTDGRPESVSAEPLEPPLYLVDGREVAGGQAEVTRTVPPDRIASVEVLKGQAAARYGAKGRRGVVLITTKTAP